MLIKKFFHYVIPTVISMWIFALYTMVDGIFVARGVGADALAAVNLSSPVNNMIFSAGILFATGSATMISFALGRGDKKEARQIFSQNLVIVCATAFAISLLILCNLDRVVSFLGGTEETSAYMKEYIRYIACFAVFFMVSYNLELQVKANGAPHVSVIGVGACGLSNVLLDYLFVMRMDMGAGGAALATGMAQMFSTIIFMAYFITHREGVRLQRFHFRKSRIIKAAGLGISNCLMEMSGALTVFLYNITILRIIGEKGVVSYTVVAYLFAFAINTMFGITQGVQPLISYSTAGGKKEERSKLIKYGLMSIGFMSFAFFAASELQTETIVKIFLKTDEKELFTYTLHAIRLYGYSFLLMGLNVFAGGVLNAMDRPEPAFAISMCRSLIFMAGSLVIMANFLGADGIWLASSLSEGLTLVVSMVAIIWTQKRANGKNVVKIQSNL